MGSSRIVREESGVWPVPAILQVFIYFRGRMAGVRRTEKGATEPGFSHATSFAPSNKKKDFEERSRKGRREIIIAARFLTTHRTFGDERGEKTALVQGAGHWGLRGGENINH